MSEANDHVLVEKAGGICTVTFNRPEKKNAFTHAMYARCVEALREAEADKNVRCILLCGAGGAFTSGNDLVDFMNTPPASADSPVLLFLLGLHDAQKPIVAAVGGVAVGIGVTMLLACDLVFASDKASFRMPFVSLGLVPEGASSLLLPRMAGHARAAEPLLLGEPFDAAAARELGIVTRVMAHDQLVEQARAQAAKLVALPAASLRATKKLMRSHDRDAVRKALAEEVLVFAQRLGSPEAAEAFQAFFEKRTPNFAQFD